ncbi:hypothetical protein Taro_050085 [Colocasia esculenta]|uniref:Dual specificity phosphatase catalytic domain-containing protein n=1 Tax=Colocasia esculenta TaxID=4460 RepID=A0A843XCS4_COLES|nr:hypothetical protein [Colocasia esculenta]
MSGKRRSPAIVIAYLMKCRGWRLAQSLHWVKERRPLVDLSAAVHQQLLDYEQKIFGSNGPDQVQPFPSTGLLPSFVFGFHKPIGAASLPTFNEKTSTSIFSRTYPDASSSEFVFRAGLMNEQMVTSTNTFVFNTAPGTEAPMDSC